MRLSAKERTALRAMAELARRYGEGLISLNEVAEAEGLPLSYLEQIASALRRSGLIHSARGVHGGYQLARKPEEITVGDIFRAVEGSLMTLDCMGADGSTCAREPICATRAIWLTVFDRLSDTLDHLSLADVLVEHGASALG